MSDTTDHDDKIEAWVAAGPPDIITPTSVTITGNATRADVLTNLQSIQSPAPYDQGPPAPTPITAPVEYDEKPIPRWQWLLAVIFLLLIICFIVFDWSRFTSDFWPFDKSSVGPNLVASVVQYAVILIALALLWPPTRRRIHHFTSYHVEHLKTELAHHRDDMKSHIDERHDRHEAALAAHQEALDAHNARLEEHNDLVQSAIHRLDHLIKHTDGVPAYTHGMSTPASGLHRGRRHNPNLHQWKTLSDYRAEGPLPAPTYPIDVSGGISSWGMLGNGPDPTLTVNNGQPVGDCGFAAMVHKTMADAAQGGESYTEPSTDAVVTSYLAYDGGQDQGVVIADMLLAWYNGQLPNDVLPAADAFVRIANDKANTDAALATFRGLIVGVNLTDDADQLFGEGQPWTTANGEQPDPNDGHCIVKIKAESAEGNDTYITWGADQQATVAWSTACVEEVWALITEQEAADHGIDISAIYADITAMGGQAKTPPTPTPAPTPAPTPPPPAPTPTPVPVTPPAPTPPPPGPEPTPTQIVEAIETALTDLAKAVRSLIHWAEGK